ncbi:MAG: hypothetical protein ACK502_01300 [Alphaproteobacteria bacterium]
MSLSRESTPSAEDFEDLNHTIYEGNSQNVAAYIAAHNPPQAELTEALDIADDIGKLEVLAEAGADLKTAIQKNGEHTLLRRIIINSNDQMLDFLLRKQPQAVFENILQYSYYLISENQTPLLTLLAINPHAPKPLKRHFRDALKEIVIYEPYEKELTKTVPNSTKSSPDTERDRYASFLHVISMAQLVVNSLDASENSSRNSNSLQQDVKTKLIAGLVNNTSGDWETISKKLEQFSYQDAKNITDMIREFTQYLVIPAFLATIPSDEWKTEMDQETYNGLMHRAMPLVTQMLLPEQNLMSLLDLSHTWHMRRDAVISAIRDEAITRDLAPYYATLNRRN